MSRISDYGDRIVYVGEVSDGKKFLADMDCVVITSDREPFPRVILEAKLCSTFVIAPNSGGCSEMIQNGVNGLLFDSNSVKSKKKIIDSVLWLITNQEKSIKMIERAHKELLDEYQSDTKAFKILKKIQE